MNSIRETAEKIAAELREIGVNVMVEHSTNSVGKSSYIFAAASNGKRFARFGARISDHSVSSSRHDIDQGRIQHYAQSGDNMETFALRLADVARRAKAHVGA